MPNRYPFLMDSLERHRDDRGDFMELARIGSLRPHGLGGFPDFKVRQINYSFIRRGAIKAWHRHQKQDDIFIVVEGVAVVQAIAPDFSDFKRFVLHGQNPTPLFIPRTWWHGISAIEDVSMIYLINKWYTGYDEEREGLDFWEDHLNELGDCWGINNWGIQEA